MNSSTDDHTDASAPLEYAVLECKRCGALDAGGWRYCPSCGADALVRSRVSGCGTLVSWTLIRRPPDGVQSRGPYAVALVDLKEGVRITARLADAHNADAETTIALGSPVRITELDDEVPVVEVCDI